MKIAVLSRNPKLYSTQRLMEAIRQRGHRAVRVDPLRCLMRLSPGNAEIMYRGKPLKGIHAVIPRIGASITFYATAVLHQFEMMGVYTPNRADAVGRARDKLRATQLLAQQGIGIPTTVFGDNPDRSGDVIDLIGEPPHVIKLVEGTQGQGVVLTDSRSASLSLIDAFRGLDANFVVQEFIGEAKGADLRAFVVGGEVVAAMQRTAKAGDFRANIHAGGSAKKIRLSRAERELAVLAAQTIGLGIAGVDLLRSDRGPLVLEVNSSPGLEGIEGATGVDVAGAIVDFIVNRKQG
jgi:ribosomal protein S6--L-glutamate ligase